MSDFLEAARRDKLDALMARGVAPFAYRFERSASARAAHDGFREGDESVHRLAGRLAALRPHGKSTFAHLEDASGRLQLYFKQDQLGEAYETLQLLDLDDHLGVEGPLFKTRSGEITLRVDRFQLLAKALRPLPRGKVDDAGARHGDLADAEMRARQRYADLAVHPDVREIFRLR
ncbi:MAG TPA: OB-fold nucleic acid binding domain-containing protein, partial [Gemmatimonadales bacterium]|nr:OB-fold nucleic acid binding domain-containing protein [Gemmatimonadales bacterium]